jgi:hypothetical protein
VAISRSSIAFIGTDESVGDTIANNATDTGALKDVLGDDTSTGELEIYLVFTSTVAAGTIDVTVVPGHRANSGTIEYTRVSLFGSVGPINGTQKLYLGRIPAPRYLGVTVKNNGTGASATNVSVLGTLTKYS